MKRSRFSEEQIIGILKEHYAGGSAPGLLHQALGHCQRQGRTFHPDPAAGMGLWHGPSDIGSPKRRPAALA
jgi:hypothetical protein